MTKRKIKPKTTAAGSINGIPIDDLCGWEPDEERIADFAMENPTLSFQAPHLMTNERKDVFLWLAILAVIPGWKRGAQGIGDCKKKGSLVVGPDAVKRVEDVRVGDRVYAGNGEITSVVSTTVKKSYNPMLTIHTKGGLPLEVTADHKVLAYRFGEYVNGNEKWRRRYSPGSYAKAVAHGGPSTVDKKATVFAERKAELVEAKDLKETDYLLCPIGIQFDKEIPDEMLPWMGDREARWLMGLFLGDGCVPKNKKSQITWACTSDEPEIESRLCLALDSLGLKWHARFHCGARSKKARVVVVSKKSLATRFYKHFYDESGQKVLPSWAICDDVIEGLIDADGHTTVHGQQAFTTTSPSLAHGVRLWAINAGYVPCMNQRDRTDGRSGKMWKRAYQVSWNPDGKSRNLWRDDDYLAMPITKIEIEEGPHDEVYDIGVAHSLHTFLDGSGAVVKNCVSWGQELTATCLMCLQHVKGQGRFIAEGATEAIYGGARVEAQGRSSGGYSDGTFGAAAAKWVRDWGVSLRVDYSQQTGIKEHDLRVYDGKKAKAWGNFGCGGSQDGGKLDVMAKEMPIQHVVQVTKVDEAAAAITNLYPFTIASMAGFGDMRRDANGMCRRSGQWAHQMCVLGIRWRAGEPEFRIFQSWGPKSCSGPDPGITHPAISGCSWWCSAADMEWILRTGDCWINGDILGLPPQKLDLVRPASFWGRVRREVTHTLAI